MLANSPDPMLDAWFWLLLRVSGARLTEALTLPPSALDVYLGSVQLLRKGARNGAQPVSRLVLRGVRDFAASRPPGRGQTDRLWRTVNGAPATEKKLVARWSTDLHEFAAWADGRELRAHAFRHVMAQEVVAVTGRVSAATALLGHDRTSAHGTTGVYTLDATFEEAADVAAACYGWPDRWPTALPEWPLLAHQLGLPTATEEQEERP